MGQLTKEERCQIHALRKAGKPNRKSLNSSDVAERWPGGVWVRYSIAYNVFEGVTGSDFPFDWRATVRKVIAFAMKPTIIPSTGMCGRPK